MKISKNMNHSLKVEKIGQNMKRFIAKFVI